MGEARRRKLTDPYFGMKPKHGRGIFLSAPVESDGRSTTVSNDIDRSELRRAALFWDRLVWPDSKIVSVASNADERILEEEGILSRPRPTRYVDRLGIRNMGGLIRIESSSSTLIGGENGRLFALEHIEEFLDLDRKEPGQWVLSEGKGSYYVGNRYFAEGRGQLVTLSRAIPLPAPNIPIIELLEFKEKRRDEIIALTFELDNFYSHISKSQDPNFELNRLLHVVDKQCADMIKVSKESRWSFHLGDLSYSFSLDVLESAMNRAVAWEVFGQTAIGMPIVGGTLGGAASLLSFGRGIGIQKTTDRSSPFSVVAKMHKELI